MIVEGFTSKGERFIVDQEDADLLAFVWWRLDNGYIAGRYTDPKSSRQIRLHRLIMARVVGYEVPEELDVDHEDLHRWNNTRRNLRIATRSQNMANTSIRSSNTSGYKGVTWSKIAKKWQAKIAPHGKTKHLGYFNSIGKAALAYNDAALVEYGEFARLNEVCDANI